MDVPISPGDIKISHQLNSQNKPIYIVQFLTHKVKSSLKKSVRRSGMRWSMEA